MNTEAIDQTKEMREEVLQVEAVAEKVFAHMVTITGDVEKFEWQEGRTAHIARNFCSTTTQFLDDEYKVEIGIDEDEKTVIVISYMQSLTAEALNYSISQLLIETHSVARLNDAEFFAQVDGKMDASEFKMMAPVIEAIVMLHTWANIASFQQNQEPQEEEVTETAADVEICEANE